MRIIQDLLLLVIPGRIGQHALHVATVVMVESVASVLNKMRNSPILEPILPLHVDDVLHAGHRVFAQRIEYRLVHRLLLVIACPFHVQPLNDRLDRRALRKKAVGTKSIKPE